MITTIVTLLGGVRATIFAAMLAVALAANGVQTVRLHSAQNDLVTQQRDAGVAMAQAQAEARVKEQAFATAASDAATQYEKGKTDAKSNADALFVNLLANSVRLQPRWQCPAATRVPAAPVAAGEPDAAAADRSASASRIVGAAESCDAQVKGLQALVLADRGVKP